MKARSAVSVHAMVQTLSKVNAFANTKLSRFHVRTCGGRRGCPTADLSLHVTLIADRGMMRLRCKSHRR
jgi:hypothetical protein